MKKLFPILLSVFIAFSYGAKKEIEKYPNGNKKSQVKLNKEGQKHGKYKAYFENKEIQITGKYENGSKNKIRTRKFLTNIFLEISDDGANDTQCNDDGANHTRKSHIPRSHK